MGMTLEILAQRVGAELRGTPSRVIHGVATLASAQQADISFLANPRYRKFLAGTRAGAVVVAPEMAAECPADTLVVKDPYVAFAKIASLLNPPRPFEPGIHPTAVVGADCIFEQDVYIGPHCVVGRGVRIGGNTFVGPGSVILDDCVIGADVRLVARVTLCERTVLGARVLIHPGAVIGADGFGQANEGGQWLKVPQLGRVVIGDDVEIGANTTIDRGALEDTRIEEGVRLDNLVQVAHNVVVGAHTIVAGCAGIAGSARIGRHCAIAGGAGIAGHIELGDHVQITAMSLVTKSIPEAGVYSSGTPLQPNAQWHRNFVRFKQLDDMARRLKALEGAASHGTDEARSPNQV
jgi:UDP-3-O-[3-hydroxymyristoyl] glucosamine N-acyltransferase